MAEPPDITENHSADEAKHGTLDFYLTAPAPCPYLPAQEEQRLLTFLDTPEKHAAMPALLRAGFRRSQNMLYRPHCPNCNACRSVRLRLHDFTPDAGQRRIGRKNASLHTTHETAQSSPEIAEIFDLFTRYQHSRHADGDMAHMTAADLADMIAEHTGHARMMMMRDSQNNLAAAMLYDALPDGASAVYSFFDPALSAQSPGTAMILQLAEDTRKHGLPYLYLGYWIAASRKMQYKSRFQPLEILVENAWKEFDAASL
ncbi:MAG: arginyltransferase [Bdellovibrionales bacterium]|jgi:arginine-tRNA-protein transferase|nr:arginyltransferase [Bdellovibrionales bacterium]